MTQCETDICAIFGPDRTIGVHQTCTESVDLEETASSSAREKWKIRYNDYAKNVRLFTLDKRKLMGITRGQMSESSQTRAYETKIGKQAMNETDPKKLLESIIATHSGDSRLRPNHHIFIIEQKYSSIVMGAHEEVAQFYQGMRSTLSAIEQASVRAGKTIPDDKYPEDQMGIKFTLW